MQTHLVRARRRTSTSTAITLSTVVLLCGASCGAPAEEPQEEVAVEVEEAAAAHQNQSSSSAIAISRSLMIVDLPTLGALRPGGGERFSLKRVLGQLAATAGVDQPISALGLYRRIWDTNNTKAQGYIPDGQHCDDETDAHGQPALNGFPLECPRQEGVLADTSAHHPFCSGPGCDPYSPIAIVNRFDLAPPNGQSCGQYRIIFGKGVGASPVETAGNPDSNNRNLLIFEAVLPNPNPSEGLAACAPVVAHWAALSRMPSPSQRARELDRFFFEGVAGFAPAFKFAHFTGAVDPETNTQTSGQIRANQFMFAVDKQPWQLREYTLSRACKGHGHHRTCGARVKMVPPKINPEARLFDDGYRSRRARAFRDPENPSGFFGQIAELARQDLNLLNMNGLSPRFNGAQSTSSPVLPDPETPVLQDTNYLARFDPSGPFASDIQDALTHLGSSLTPVQIVRRAQTQSCAGCHELSTSTAAFFGGSADANDVGFSRLWPDAALGAFPIPPIPAFTQVSESLLVPLSPTADCAACVANPTTCRCAWAISEALEEVFLPFRRDNMATFMSGMHWSHGSYVSYTPGDAHSRVTGSPHN